MNINKICPLLSKTAIDNKSQTYALCIQQKCGFWDSYNKACGIASIAWFQAQTAETLNKIG